MRSRYSAFAKRNPDYLEHSWHPVTRPVSVRVRDGQRWTGLSVVRTVDGGPDDDHGTVEFEARYEVDGAPGVLREISEFARWGGRWVYVGVDAANSVAFPDVEPR